MSPPWLIGSFHPSIWRAPQQSRSRIHHASAYASIGAADAAAAAADGVLVIDVDATLTVETTLRSSVVAFAGGRVIRGEHALVFEGVVEAGRQRIFDVQTERSGEVRFLTLPDAYHPEWWGAANDGVTDDYWPLQAALDAAKAHGGRVVLRGPYHTHRQLVATTDGPLRNAYEIDGYGASISTFGPIYGLEVRSYNTARGPVVKGLMVDHTHRDAAQALGGLLCRGAIWGRLIDCSVLASSSQLGSRRGEYHGIVVEAYHEFGSYWCLVENCSVFVPDAHIGFIGSAVLVRHNSNSVKIMGGRFSGVRQGIRIESERGEPNSVVIRDTAVEAYSDAAVYVIHTGTDDTFVWGLMIDGLRCEPHNDLACAVWLTSVQGGQRNPTAYGRFDKIVMSGGAEPYRLDGNCRHYVFHSTDVLHGVAAFRGGDSVQVDFQLTASNGLNAIHWATDTDYHVSLSPAAGETLWVTDKTTAGFTIRSANPTSTARVEWRVTR